MVIQADNTENMIILSGIVLDHEARDCCICCSFFEHSSRIIPESPAFFSEFSKSIKFVFSPCVKMHGESNPS